MTDLSALYTYVQERCTDAEILAYLVPCSYQGRRVVREALAGIREEARSNQETQGEIL